MKPEGTIRHKLGQVFFRHRKDAIERGLTPAPHNCAHNGTATADQTSIRVCRYVDEQGVWNNKICDGRFGGMSLAAQCPYFEAKHSADELKKQFRESVEDVLKSEDSQRIGRLAQRFPDVMALLWVLGEDLSEEFLEAVFEDPLEEIQEIDPMPSSEEDP